VKKSLEIATQFNEITEAQQALENGIRVLARIIIGALTKELEHESRQLCRESNRVKSAPGHIDAATREERLTFTVTEAAKLLGISRPAMYEAIRTNQIPSVRIGRRIIIPRVALINFLEN